MNPKSTIDYAGKGYSSEADYNRYSMDAKVSPNQQVTNEKFATPQSNLIGTQQGNTLVNTRVNPISTITADTLTPSAPIVIPPRKTSDTANIELGASIAGAMLPPTNSELNASGLYTPAKQSETDATKQRINELMGQAKNKATDTATINEQNQISQKEQAYRDASNAYLRKKATYQQEIEKIYSDPYITREQAQQKVSEISRIQNADLANLAIESNIAQGNYQGALDLADRAIKAKYEPIEAEIKNLKDLYTLYQNDMTESEKLLAQQAYQEKQNEIDFNREKELIAYKERVTGKSGGGTGTLSSLAQSVIDNPSLFYNFTPTQKAQIIGELQSGGYDISNLQNVKLSTSQQEDIASMTTVKSLIDDVLGNQKNGVLPGIGYKLGTLKGIGAQLGFGTEDEKSVRANIGNIRGTIAKLRGGTSFTTNEEKLLNTYTPNIDDSSNVAISKLSQLKSFIDKKNRDLIGSVKINPSKGQITKQGEIEVITRPEDLRAKYNY